MLVTVMIPMQITMIPLFIMFKHAPLLGRRLARAVLGDGVPESLHPQANLGAERFSR